MPKKKSSVKSLYALILAALLIPAIIIIAQYIQKPKEVTEVGANVLPPGVLYAIDFETGDYSQLTGPNAKTIAGGGLEGPDGAYFGKGVFWETKLVNSPAIGNHAATLTIGSGSSTAAYLFTYKTPSTATATYQADFYIPSSITPSNWWNLWQWKSLDNTYNKPIIDLNVLRINGVWQLVMNYVPGGVSSNPTQTIKQSSPIPFPTDRFVNIKGVYTAKSDNTGSVKIYQEGQLIFEKSGFMSKPGDKPVAWSINSYADAINPNPATIYVDNIIVNEGDQEISVTPTPTASLSPSLSPTIKPSIMPSSSPTPTPTATPTPVVQKIAPQFVTTSLPEGKRGEYYSATIVATDVNLSDVLRMSSSRWPKGLKFGNCSQDLVNGKKQIACQVSGTPSISTSSWITTLSVRDSAGLRSTTKLGIVIY